MDTLKIICQLVISLGILNVWVLRSKQPTPYRGGSAQNMSEEFAAYGLSSTFMSFIGGVKVLFALLLLVGILLPVLVLPAATGLAILMGGALIMHVKIKDPAVKSLPAFCVLLLCLLVIIL